MFTKKQLAGYLKSSNSPVVRALKTVVRKYRGQIRSKVEGLPFPPVINVESTNACNAGCIMCPHKGMERPVGFMSLELLRQVVDECVGKRVNYFGLHFFGEPLMDPEIFDKIAYAKERGLGRVGFFTNAALLGEERAGRLIKLGLDYLTVSFDGATKETYEKVRRGLRFEAVAENIRRLLQLRRQEKAKKPLVNVVLTLTEETKGEEKEFLAEWRGIADGVEVCPAHDWAGGIFEGCFRREGVLKAARPRPPCSRLWLNPVILCDGRVSLCCLDFEGRIILGDIREKSLSEIWNDGKVNEMRKLHLAGRFEEIGLCRSCTAWDYMNPWWW